MRAREFFKKPIITELFKQPVQWTYTKNHDIGLYMFKFTVEDIPITAKARYLGDGKYGFTFANDNDDSPSLDTTEEGHQFTILATIIDIIKNFLESKKPKSLIFSASLYNRGKKDGSRARIYTTLAKRNKPKDYDLTITNIDKAVSYLYTRKEETSPNTQDIIIGSVHKIISAWQRADQSDYEKHKRLIDTKPSVTNFVEKIVQLIGGNQKDKIPPVTFSMINRTPIDRSSKLTVIAFLIADEDKIPTRVVRNTEPVGESIITEVFKKPVQWTYTKYHNIGLYMFKFTVEDIPITAKARYIDDGEYRFTFANDNSPFLDTTEEGHQFTILATIIDIIKNFVEFKKPKSLVFDASLYNKGKKDGSRARIYTTLAKRNKPKDYDLTITNIDKAVSYLYTRKEEASPDT